MKRETPNVSIIVLNWNGKRFVDSFFNSLQKQDYPAEKIEVLFVDNASSDDSVNYFKQLNYPNSCVVQTGSNLGYSGGNNFGIKKATGAYVVVCNNDLELDPAWLAEMVETAERTGADVVVPKLIYADSNLINNAGSMLMPTTDWPNNERGMGEPASSKEFKNEAEITAFCGASPLFRRSFFHDVGLFDARFFLYWEDVDLSWRGQKARKKYIYQPKAVAYHDTSGTTGGSTSPVFIHYVSRNRLLVLVKHGSVRVIIRGFAKVGRDHIVYKLRDLWSATKRKQGRMDAIAALWMGVKIIMDALRLAPIMLLKRRGIMKEEFICEKNSTI